MVKTAPSQDAQLSRAISLRNYPGKGMDGTVFLADLTQSDLAESFFHVIVHVDKIIFYFCWFVYID